MFKKISFIGIILFVCTGSAHAQLGDWVFDAPDAVLYIDAGNGGPWGGWANEVICPTNSYVFAFRQLVEGRQGRGDDTAMNRIQVACSTHDGRFTGIMGSSGRTNWGSWGSWAYSIEYAAGGPFSRHFVDMDTKVEASQGSGDDTRMNAISFINQPTSSREVSNGSYYERSSSNNDGPWGTFSGTYVERPVQHRVCGVKAFGERNISGDDTAMNSIRLRFCKVEGL